MGRPSLTTLKSRLTGVLSNIDSSVWSIDADTYKTLYLNSGAERMYGRTASAFYADHLQRPTPSHQSFRASALQTRRDVKIVRAGRNGRRRETTRLRLLGYARVRSLGPARSGRRTTSLQNSSKHVRRSQDYSGKSIPRLIQVTMLKLFIRRRARV
jgi:hypothetical protein